MGLWRDRTRGDWRYSFQHQKKVYAGGGYKTKADARTAREDRRKQVKNPPNPPPKGMGLLEAANLYLDWSKRRHAPGNVKNKLVVFRRLMAYLEITAEADKPIIRITPSLISDFLSTAPSSNSFNNYRKELSALFSWVQKIHMLELANPCLRIEKLPGTTPEKSIPTRQEFLKLLAAADKDERPLLLVLTHTLARIDEVLRLTWQDVNFEQRTVTLWTRKNRGGEWKSRILGMNSELKTVLMPMWNRRRQDKWVFWNERTRTRYLRRPKFMRRICWRAGIPHYGFHAIRHFTATYLHDVLKVPTGVLAGILGHENRRTTEIYLHSINEAQRDALMRLEGVFPATSMFAVSLGTDGIDGLRQI